MGISRRIHINTWYNYRLASKNKVCFMGLNNLKISLEWFIFLSLEKKMDILITFTILEMLFTIITNLYKIYVLYIVLSEQQGRIFFHRFCVFILELCKKIQPCCIEQNSCMQQGRNYDTTLLHWCNVMFFDCFNTKLTVYNNTDRDLFLLLLPHYDYTEEANVSVGWHNYRGGGHMCPPPFRILQGGAKNW